MNNLDKLIASGILGEMEKSATKWRQLYRAGQLGKKSVGRLIRHPTTKGFFSSGVAEDVLKPRKDLGLTFRFPGIIKNRGIGAQYYLEGMRKGSWDASRIPRLRRAGQDDFYTYLFNLKHPTLSRTKYTGSLKGSFRPAEALPPQVQPTGFKKFMNKLYGKKTPKQIPDRPRILIEEGEKILPTVRHELGHWKQYKAWRENTTSAEVNAKFIDSVMRQADPSAYKRLYTTAGTQPLTEIQGHYLGSLRGHGGARLRQATANNWSDPYAKSVRNWNATHRQQLPQEKLDAVASSLEHVRRNYGMNTGGGPLRPFLP